MGIGLYKTECGQGGRRGHSNMAHYDATEWLKAGSRKVRRMQSKRIIAEVMSELDELRSAPMSAFCSGEPISHSG
jgi:hypothetical protein